MVLGDMGGLGEAAGDPVGELLLASARGDRDAFAGVYDRLAARAFGLVVRIVPDPALAETVLRDAFREAWRAVGAFTPAAGSGPAWVFDIVHRRAVAERATPSSGEPAVEARVEGRRMVRAFAALSDEQRATLAQAYFGGQREADIVAASGASVDAVRATLRDGLSRVRSELGIMS